MPKERAPIATRLRKRDPNPTFSQPQHSEDRSKREDSVSATSVQSMDDNLPFSPRTDPDIHLDELHANLSFTRGTDEEKNQYLKDEQDRMQKSFGKSYNSRVKLSTFYQALVAPPIPSKRTRHRSQSSSSSPVTPPRPTKTPKISKPIDDDKNVPLPLNTTLPVNSKLNAKDKEKEYWRRQRRVFVHSRFLTNEEGMQVAKSVYSNLVITPTNRMVTSFQGNIGNFRTKLRRVFDTFTASFGINKEFLQKDTAVQEKHVLERLNTQNVKSIWGHWIADPFVDTKLFYSNKESVELLKLITAKLMVIHYMEHFNLLSAGKSRQKMKDVDMISRKLDLPDTSEFA